MNRIYLLLVLAFLFACSKNSSESRKNTDHSHIVIKLKYAEGFTIRKDSIYTWVDINTPSSDQAAATTYLLLRKDISIPADIGNAKIVRTPVSSIVCSSTTHIPLLDYLDESEKLVGFPSTDYISSKKTRRLIDAGKVVDVGVDAGMNIEILSSIKPELVMAYTMSAEHGQFKKIEELGIPVLVNNEYLEKHPLGRAEWIKLVGLLFDKEQEADSIFNAIESSYLQTKALVAESKERPTVLTGIVYSDGWALPGGKNYAATILRDAGFNYLWAEDPSYNPIKLSFEAVYQKAHDADFWIGVGTFRSLQEMANAEDRYKKFKAFKSKQVYNYDARRGEKGGNEYLELGYLRPDIILKDLITISRPDLLKDHELFFYRRLD